MCTTALLVRLLRLKFGRGPWRLGAGAEAGECGKVLAWRL